MNLLLLTEAETASVSEVTLQGRRARHLHRVLRAKVGQKLRAGILGKGPVSAEVLEITADSVRLALGQRRAAKPPARKCLVLAMPRPKVLSRCLQHASALGFTEIALCRSYRVEKSHLLSRKATIADQQSHLLLGLEQAGRFFMPSLSYFDRFRPFVEDELPELATPDQRFVGHPTARRSTGEIQLQSPSYSLAIGPEGGFIPFELDALAGAGFRGVNAGSQPLRVESALSYLTGQFDLLAACAVATKQQ